MLFWRFRCLAIGHLEVSTIRFAIGWRHEISHIVQTFWRKSWQARCIWRDWRYGDRERETETETDTDTETETETENENENETEREYERE